MSLPKADEIAALVALVSYGLIAREAYRRRVPRRAEGDSQTILWAVFWSAPLKLIFDAFGAPHSELNIDDQNVSLTVAFLINVGCAGVIGYVVGVIVANYTDWRRTVEPKPLSSYHSILQVLLRRPPRTDLIHQWLQETVREQWVFVELKDGRTYMGAVRRYDLLPERIPDMHIVLTKPSLIGTQNEIVGSVGRELLLPLTEISLIRLAHETVAEPSASEVNSTTGDKGGSSSFANLLALLTLTTLALFWFGQKVGYWLDQSREREQSDALELQDRAREAIVGPGNRER